VSNVYRQPAEPKRKEPPWDGLTVDQAAAHANVRVKRGYIKHRNPYQEKGAPIEQPFWFVHQLHERVGVYVEAPRVDMGGYIAFPSREVREQLRDMLVNYRAHRQMNPDMTLMKFAGIRGFALKKWNGRRG